MQRAVPNRVTADAVVQDHRFDLVNEFGCLPSAQTSLPAFLIIWIPLGFFAMAIPAVLSEYNCTHSQILFAYEG